jgi:kinetochor protein Mis14/NSL1
MDSEHRKIELQSPSDLIYLTSLLRTAARQKLDLHLPPVNDTSEPDELRRAVEEQVDAFVAQVIAGMRSNISINGIDVVPSEDMEGVIGDNGNEVEKEEYEVYDEKLRGKLGTAVKKRDALIKDISEHRRGTAAVAAKAFQTRFEAENEALLADMETALGDGEVVGVEALEREDEVRRNWERAVEGLGRLDKGLPETRARLERAGEVVGYLGEGK